MAKSIAVARVFQWPEILQWLGVFRGKDHSVNINICFLVVDTCIQQPGIFCG